MTDVPAPVHGPEPETRAPGLLLVITGALGLLAAFVLSVDKVQQLRDALDGKDSSFACDLSPWISCSGVMASPQSAAFGFPNSFIGILGFAVVLTIGVLVMTGSPVRRWVWLGLQAGTIFGIAFVTWLQVQSIYEIGKLCPYCMVVWAVMIPLFVGVTAHTLRLVAPDGALTRFLSNWTVLIVALWYIAIAAAIWFKFGALLFT